MHQGIETTTSKIRVGTSIEVDLVNYPCSTRMLAGFLQHETLNMRHRGASLYMPNSISTWSFNVATPLLEECEDETHTPKMGTWESTGTSETLEFDCRGQNTSPWGIFILLENYQSVDVKNGLA
jgi:hypothetical protein